MAAAIWLAPAVQTPALAIDIVIQLDDEGYNPPSDPTGVLLRNAFNAAAEIWERLLPQAGVYEVDVAWNSYEIPDGGMSKWYEDFAGDNNIYVNPIVPWFFDTSPLSHSEFNFDSGTTLYRDLSASTQSAWFNGSGIPGALEVGYSGTATSAAAMNRYDLLSVCLHVLGHELGINPELDGKFEIYPIHLAGQAGVSVKNTLPIPFNLPEFPEDHLRADTALMTANMLGHSRRVLPSAIDVLTIAEDQGLTSVNLARKHFVAPSGLWSLSSNWIGNRVPELADQVFISQSSSSVPSVVDVTSPAQSLRTTVSMGADLRVVGSTLTVNQHLSVQGVGSNLFIQGGGAASIGTGEALGGGAIDLTGGTLLAVTLATDVNSQLKGNVGTSTITVLTKLTNNGIIRSSGGLLEFDSPAASPWDLDGAANFGVIDAQAGSIRFRGGGLADNFSGRLAIGAGRYFHFSDPWIMEGGRLDMTGGSTDAMAAEIRGDAPTFSGVEINVLGHAAINAITSWEQGTTVTLLDGNSELEIGDANSHGATFRSSQFVGPGQLVQNGDSSVQLNATVNIAAADYDWDGQAATASDMLVQGTLQLWGTRITDQYSGTLTIDGGTVDVRTQPWQLNGRLAMSDAGRLTGSARMTLSAPLTVNGTNNRIEAPVTFAAGANVNVAGGSSELILAGATTYAGGSYSGFGVLRQQGVATVTANTTIGIDQGFYLGTTTTAVLQAPLWLQRFDWDGPGAGTAARTTINSGVTFTINAVQIDDDPGADGYDGIATINGGTLLVNTGPRVPIPFALPPGVTQQAPVQPVPAPWRLDGTINLAGTGATPAVVGSAIGSSMLIYGAVNATGGPATIQLATLVSGAVNVAGGATLTAQGLTVSGGNVAVNLGGTVRLAGATLQPATNMTLQGQMQVVNASLRGGTYNGTGLIAQTGTLQVQESTTLGVRTNFNAGSTTTISSGRSLVMAAGGRVESGATITGGVFRHTGTVSDALFLADGSAILSTFENHGRLVLFDSVNVVSQATVSTFAQSAAGSLEIKLGGTAVDLFDSLGVVGAASLHGSLTAVLYNGFVPALGNSFDILTAGSMTGAFASTALPPLGGGLGWQVFYGPSSVRLEVVTAPSFAADGDGDGDVDADDLNNYWKPNFGVGNGGDFDGDGDTDGADFLVWQRQLGSGLPATAAQVGVPEPPGLALAALAGLAAATRRATSRRFAGASLEREANAQRVPNGRTRLLANHGAVGRRTTATRSAEICIPPSGVGSLFTRSEFPLVRFGA